LVISAARADAAKVIFMRRIFLLCAATLALLASTACGLEKTSTPDGYSGPSEFGISLTMTASPELLPRDGVSQSLVAIMVRDSSGNPIANRAVRVSASAGRLSAGEVTSGTNGVATVTFTAPGANEDVDLATILVAPSGTDWASSMPRALEIRIVGASIPVPSFVWTPVAPARFALTAFDASATTVGATRCGAACTYAWDFNGEASASGQSVTYRFQNEGTYRVTLTVTTPNGTWATASNNVTVGAGVRPTAVIRVSPASPCVDQAIFFNASESTAASGAEIAEYEWDFGDGTTQSTASSTASQTYSRTGTYTVLLTVFDSNGLRGSATVAVVVRGPTTSGTPPVVTPCQ
jgi:PKD repeat protein